MKFVVIFLSIFIFLKTFYYGLYEIKQQNKIGGYVVIFLSFISLVAPNIILLFRRS